MDRQALVVLDRRGADDEQLDELTEALRNELGALDGARVLRLSGGEPPPGARAAELAAVGALVVTIKGSVDLLRELIDAIRSWLGRSAHQRTVQITIGDRSLRIENASAAQQDRLIEEFVRVVARA